MISSVKEINKMMRKSLREVTSDKMAWEGLFKEITWGRNLKDENKQICKIKEEQSKQRKK